MAPALGVLVTHALQDRPDLRAAAQGHRPAMGMRQTEQLSSDEAANIPLEGYSDGVTESAPESEGDE